MSVPKTDRDIRNITQLILANVAEDKRKDVRKLLIMLEDRLYDKHLTFYTTDLKWLSSNVRSLRGARKLTDNFDDAAEIISLAEQVRSMNGSELKETINHKISKGIYSEEYLDDMEEAVNLLDIDDLKKLFDKYVK